MKVVFLPLAENDLGVLFGYISKDLKNPVAAQNIIERILRLTGKLELFPEIGASLKLVDVRLSRYRYLVVGNYLIIYSIVDDEVHIIRILYGRSDYVQLLTG